MKEGEENEIEKCKNDALNSAAKYVANLLQVFNLSYLRILKHLYLLYDHKITNEIGSGGRCYFGNHQANHAVQPSKSINNTTKVTSYKETCFSFAFSCLIWFFV